MMIPPARTFKTLGQRNRAFEAVRRAVGLCESERELEQLKEEYRDELDRLRADQNRFDNGFNLYHALMECFSERAHFLTHDMEFDQCLSHRLPKANEP